MKTYFIYFADDGEYEGDDDENEYLHIFATRFRFGLRLLNRANDHAYYHNISQP